jgi:hypothetical protein
MDVIRNVVLVLTDNREIAGADVCADEGYRDKATGSSTTPSNASTTGVNRIFQTDFLASSGAGTDSADGLSAASVSAT